jgi:hypothetical protein
MNEAKPQDGKTVKGYRSLSVGDIERMNRLKDASRHFCSLLATEEENLREARNRGEIEAPEFGQALRWLAIAKTDMQTACMCACRAVARPDSDC